MSQVPRPWSRPSRSARVKGSVVQGWPSTGTTSVWPERTTPPAAAGPTQRERARPCRRWRRGRGAGDAEAGEIVLDEADEVEVASGWRPSGRRRDGPASRAGESVGMVDPSNARPICGRAGAASTRQFPVVASGFLLFSEGDAPAGRGSGRQPARETEPPGGLPHARRTRAGPRGLGPPDGVRHPRRGGARGQRRQLLDRRRASCSGSSARAARASR